MRSSAACQEQANARTDTAPACVRKVVQAYDNNALSCEFKSKSRRGLCDDRCPEVAACDGLLTVILQGRVASALDTRISHVPGRY
jgi:hypothetical protein